MDLLWHAEHPKFLSTSIGTVQHYLVGLSLRTRRHFMSSELCA